MDEKEGPKLFGRDISKIPCFRDTFLFSITSGIGAALAYFVFTSNVHKATRFGLGIYGITTIGYWSQCRYKYSKKKFEIDQMKKAIAGDEA